MEALRDVSHLLARWAHFYGQTRAVSAAVTYLHLVGILSGGGLAIAADAAALRLSPDTVADWPRELDRLAAVHRWVVGGLAVIFASGLLLLLAEVDTFATSGCVLDQDGARRPAHRQRLRTVTLGDCAAARLCRPLGLVPAHIDREPRALVSRAVVRHAAPLDHLTSPFPPGIPRARPQSLHLEP